MQIPPAKVVGALHDLLKSGCFPPAAETERIPKPGTVLSLKELSTLLCPSVDFAQFVRRR
jgi:hypothetical protein